MDKFPTAPGVPTIGAYIPEIYAKELLIEFYIATVIAAISNTDYEGEIKAQGDTVIIRALPEVEVSDYVKGQKLTYPYLEPPSIELVIDRAKKYTMNAPDIDQVQSDIAYLSKWAAHGGEKLKIAIDRDCLGRLPAAAHAKNAGDKAGKVSGSINLGKAGAPISLANTNVLSTMLLGKQAIAEQDIDVTTGGKLWAVMPAWVSTRIQTSMLSDASKAGDGVTMIRNGRLGVINNITLYESNNLLPDEAGGFHIIMGHKDCYTFASQLIKNETLRNYDDFGDIMRGLQVYGDKVTKPEGIVDIYVTEAAISGI